MYAQCPECMTYFRITSAQLRAAEGQVRCSKCQTVFNAVTTLRETLSEAELSAAREEQGAIQALAASSNLPVDDLFDVPDDLEQEDIVLEIPGYQDEPQTAGELSDLDDEDALDAFLEPDMADTPGDEADFQAADKPGDETDLQANEFDSNDIAVPRELEEKVRELDNDVAPEIALGLIKRRDWLADTLWTLLAFGLFSTLGMQLAHHFRHTLAAHPAAGPILLRAYEVLGVEFVPRRDLAALRITRSTVTAHETLDSALRITGVLTNRASFPQHFPIIRVLLQDRWGETVGGRYLLPREYLFENDPQQLMQPGKRYNVDIAVLDPGKDAVGFEMVPCILQKDRRICRGNPASDTR